MDTKKPGTGALAFSRDSLTLYPAGKEHCIGGPVAATGAFYEEDGSLLFRLYAPKAEEVYVRLEGLTVHHGLDLRKPAENYDFPLIKGEDGLFAARLPAGELKGYYGILPFTFVVDGANMLSPFCRTVWDDDRRMNCVEIPDPELEDVFSIRDVPHGSVSYETFWSSARNDWAQCTVYTPPMYQAGGTYPVIYLQHGKGHNETSWFTCSNLCEIMDNLLAEGRAVPCVIVMNNTFFVPPKELTTIDEKGLWEFGSAEKLIVADCIPFIEGRYRVRTDKWGRAVAGLSRGSMQASFIGFRNPDLFGSIGLFSSSIRCRRYWNDYEASPHLGLVRAGRDAIDGKYALIYRGVAEQEYATRSWHREDDEYLHELGIDTLPCYHRTLHPTMCHQWGCFRRSLYDFVQLVFREA